MGPFEKFKYEMLANLFRGLNTLWQIWGVILADPIQIFDASAWEALFAALIAAGVAFVRQLLMDATKLFKDFLMTKGAALLSLIR